MEIGLSSLIVMKYLYKCLLPAEVCETHLGLCATAPIKPLFHLMCYCLAMSMAPLQLFCSCCPFHCFSFSIFLFLFSFHSLVLSCAFTPSFSPVAPHGTQGNNGSLTTFAESLWTWWLSNVSQKHNTKGQFSIFPLVRLRFLPIPQALL